MSWLFSQALVEEYSAATSSDGEPSAQLNVMHTPHPFWRNDKTIEPSRLSQFGPTCAVLTADRGEGVLTWFLEASLARTSASPDQAPDWRGLVAGSGGNTAASCARFDPDSSTLKTAQNSLIEDLPTCSPILPRSGLMLDGACYPLPPLERGINAIACGFSRPPRTFPTPTATSHKGWSKNHNRAGTDDRLDYTVEREAYHAGQTGRLNPAWVEWLMGWPIGWTESVPLETDKFREWRQQHGMSLWE